ncbi:MAG: hypothetical protein HYY62_00185 [Deltaproteobacteria bacterium]|nr:hypothetical protein [Deltaproteobacteria bacterium]
MHKATTMNENLGKINLNLVLRWGCSYVINQLMLAGREKNLEEYKQAILKSLKYLKQSYEEIQTLSPELKNASSETLKSWESYVARFARVTDIFLMKYIRARILLDDPGFQGTFNIRELRNQATHEYTERELEPYLKKIKELTPIVLSIEEKISNS